MICRPIDLMSRFLPMAIVYRTIVLLSSETLHIYPDYPAEEMDYKIGMGPKFA